MTTQKQLAALKKGRESLAKKRKSAKIGKKTGKKPAKKATKKSNLKGTAVKKTTVRQVPSYDIYLYNAAGNPEKPQKKVRGISIVVSFVKAALKEGATEIVIDRNLK